MYSPPPSVFRGDDHKTQNKSSDRRVDVSGLATYFTEETSHFSCLHCKLYFSTHSFLEKDFHRNAEKHLQSVTRQNFTG